jgi:O-antigen/teichoic acid export membrane protein
MSEKGSEKSLKSRAVLALKWTGSEVLIRQVLQFGTAVYMAHQLSPEEFGTYALLAIFTDLGVLFIEGGFTTAILLKRETTKTDESTIFWFNILIAAVVSFILWVLAPIIAAFYNRPVLAPLLEVQTINMCIAAIGGTQHSLLTKKLEFKTPMLSATASIIFSSIVVCVLGFYGFGIWSLAAQNFTYNLVNTALLFILGGWRPHLLFSFRSLKEMFALGSFYMLTGFVTVLYARLYSLIIGKYYSVHDLGIYNRAENTKQLPVDLLQTILHRVATPLLVTAADEKDRLRRGLVMANQGIMFLNIPILIGLLATSDNVVPVLFGNQWQESVPFLYVLCLSGLFMPIIVVNSNILKAIGHSNLYFKLELFKRVVALVLVVVGLQFGIMGLAWSQVVGGVLNFWLSAYFSGKFLQYGIWKQTLDFLPVTLIATVMGVVVFAAGQVFEMPMSLLLLTQIAIGAFLYGGLCFLFKVNAYSVVLAAILKRRSGSPD